MMEASPTSSFELSEAEFAFQLLVVALDAPAQLDEVDEDFERRVLSKVDSQYFVGSASPSGHSTTNHSTGCGAAKL